MTVDPGAPGTPMSERMQSLLSRAVEDQLSEQRQLAGVLADLRAQLQRIANDVAELRGAPASGGSVDVSEAMLASVSADVREAVRLLGERLDGVARLVQQRGHDLAELRAATGELQATVRGQGEALAGVASGLAALPAFGERIGGLQDNLADLHGRLSALDEMNGTAGVLNQRVEHMAQELRELRSAFAGIGARIAELPGRADVGGAVDAAAARSAQPLADVSQRLGRLEAALSQLSASVSALNERQDEPVEEAGDEPDRMEELASALQASAHATQERVSALEDRLNELLAAITEEEEPAPAVPAEPADDPVLVELGELWEALFGDGGLAAKVEAAATDDVDARVGTAVERAVSAAEGRLSAHIDEAVLALAEALLRRRTTRPGATVRASGPEPAVTELRLDEAPADETTADDAPLDAAPNDEPADDGDSDAAPWQTPPGAGQRDIVPEDADRRRRPWWRPGD